MNLFEGPEASEDDDTNSKIYYYRNNRNIKDIYSYINNGIFRYEKEKGYNNNWKSEKVKKE